MGRHWTALGWILSAAGAITAAVGVVLVIGSGGDSTAAPQAAPTAASSAPPATPAPSDSAAATTPPSTSATTTTRAATTTAATTTTTTVTVPAPTSTVSAETAVGDFFVAFTAALRSGDADFLITHLHPFVYDRYTSDACTTQLAQLQIPDGAVDVVSVEGAGSWDWVTDGLHRTVEGVTTVATRTTSDGITFTDAESHVVVGGDGTVQWFTDCGDPKEGAT